MNREIKRKVKARKKEAKDKKIYEKALVVVAKHGKHMDKHGDRFHETVREFEKDKINVYCELGIYGNVYIRIKEDQQLVFELRYLNKQLEILAYVPGENWETMLDELSAPIREKISQTVKKKEQEQDIKDRFGL